MNRVWKTLIVAALLFSATRTLQVAAQSSGGPYRIDPVAIAGGGGPIAGGPYQITSTMGQPATSSLLGANYRLFNGFWSPVGGVINDTIFLGSFEP